MSNEEVLCSAIASRNLVQFDYTGDEPPGTKVVEPHMVSYTTEENLVLSAWFLGRAGESPENQGWREYLLEDMSSLVILPEKFVRLRPGYNPGGGRKFHRVRCRLY